MRPQGRYGSPPSPDAVRRRLVVAFAVFTTVIVAWAAWFAWNDAQRVRWQDLTFSIVDDSRAQMTFEVSIPAGTTAVCTVRARNLGFVEVGRVDVRVGPFAKDTGRATVVVPTSERAVNAEVKACVRG